MIKAFVFFILMLGAGVSFAETDALESGSRLHLSPTELQKLKSQADALEDQGAQAIDDGNIDQALDFMVRAIQMDPSPLRYMNYGSILVGNGVAVFKNGDHQKGIVMLQQAEVQLRKAIKGFDPNRDQVYLGQCYFLLGEIYHNAFDDDINARNYYQQAIYLNDYPGAREALSKLSS